MELEKLKQLIKGQFEEISEALFKGSISLDYLEQTDRVSAEASPMFGLNIVRYSESNFKYFYALEKYLCNVVDILNLKVLDANFKKLELQKDLLDLGFINQISAYEAKEVLSQTIFFETNYILNLFVYLHECGHLNQEPESQESSTTANHFSEFNADYYALTKILLYYHTLKTIQSEAYWKKVQEFGNEHNFIRTVITTALLVIFLDVLSRFNSDDTETHPAIKKRFCYLIVQTVQQLNTNFASLFVKDTLNDFMVDIFNTMHFIENIVFEKHDIIFDNLLNFCFTDLEEIQAHLESSSEFKKFNQ